MTTGTQKGYATRVVKKAEAALHEALADYHTGRAGEVHVERARRALDWARQVRLAMDTMPVGDAYDTASATLAAQR